MYEFIKVQYALYKSGYQQSVNIDKLKALAKIYLTAEEFTEIFASEVDTTTS
jgi:hypothetical protein